MNYTSFFELILMSVWKSQQKHTQTISQLVQWKLYKHFYLLFPLFVCMCARVICNWKTAESKIYFAKKKRRFENTRTNSIHLNESSLNVYKLCSTFPHIYSMVIFYICMPCVKMRECKRTMIRIWGLKNA